MKPILLLLVALSSFPTWSAELPTAEQSLLVGIVTQVVTAYEIGDAETIAELTFEPLVAAAGGADAFRAIAKQAIEQQRKMGMSIESITVGKPGEPISAGQYTLCFIPKVTVMRTSKRLGKSTSFMVAVRNAENPRWQFIEGAGVRKNPQILKLLFPELPDDVSLPEYKVEFLP